MILDQLSSFEVIGQNAFDQVKLGELTDHYTFRVSAEPLPQNLSKDFVMHSDSKVIFVFDSDLSVLLGKLETRRLGSDIGVCAAIRNSSEYKPGFTFVSVRRSRSSKVDIFSV